MLHELLLSIWGCSTSLEKIVESDSTLFDKYFHPGEKGIIKKVLSIANDYNTIKNFIKTYSSINIDQENANEVRILKQGLYLQALCDGMDQSLEPFADEIIQLEKSIINNIHLPATAVLSTVENYQHLFNVLIRIISKIKTQNIHGCALLQCIHELQNTGVVEINVAMQKMLRCGHTIFYKQLTSWLLYGHLEDVHGEFFIQKIKTTADNSSFFGNVNNSGANEKLNDMWNYDIAIAMLPSYITLSLATKILTIGQTIIVFGNDPRRGTDFSTIESSENPVWGKREHEYFRKLQNLQMKPVFNIVELENTINELKHCVTKLLWHVAVNDAHLLQQLKLIKDFYLIGRGDLFLDFIKLTSHILNKIPVNHTSRDVNLAFQMTIRRMLLSDENSVDNFNFLVPVPDSDSENINNKNVEPIQKDRQDPIDKQGWGLIILQYRVVWPLQLLFSPKTLNDYNNIFRFLLRVKKTQINLWNLWSEHTRSKDIDISVLQLRNHLIFILDNLQYYLQVDVLESQYTIMENRVKNTENFEDVQIAHSTFLANILSQTFLTNTSGKSKNPVNNLIRLLLRLCDDFILHASIWEVTHLLSTEKEELKTLTDTLSSVMELLIKTLNRVRAQPSGAHLAQLLLRLDFNRWFSKQM
ncbi:gamma-tubulin complex component 4 isoform X2 [Chelonus insularis]|uniref:gamma-tubulin complex component 4 isoform X2 n=1 Tax=Chelonus insularis TaxID=460826 RepID=UPI00158C1CAD|nr:gamma-tubulin complex component 4 isoform X2 [Chelonus insularis]